MIKKHKRGSHKNHQQMGLFSFGVLMMKYTKRDKYWQIWPRYLCTFKKIFVRKCKLGILRKWDQE